MKKIYTPGTVAIFLLLLCGTPAAGYSQQVKDTAAYQKWSVLMEKGKRQTRNGLIYTGIGATLLTICAFIEPPERKPGWNFFPELNTGQVITGIGGFVFATAGIINLISGPIKIGKARRGMSEATYSIHPGLGANGPTLAIRVKLFQ